MRTTATLRIFISILIGTLAFAAQAADLTWNTGDGTWDTDTGNTPWNPGPTYFTDGDNATFESTAGSGGTISIPVSVAPGSTTVTGALDYTFTGAGGITSGTLDKSGSGTLTLTNGNNTFSDITLAGGTLAFNHVNRLGTTAAGTTIDVTADTTLESMSHTNINLPMSIAGGATVTFARDSSWYNDYNAQISGDGGIRIIGTAGNRWNFSNANNTFSGGIVVEGNAGFNGNGSLGAAANTLFLNSGTLRLDGEFAANRTIETTGGWLSSGGGTWNGLITGDRTGYIRLDGNLALTNPNNDFTASSFFINTGQLAINHPGNVNGLPIGLANAGLSSIKIIDTPVVPFTNTLSLGGFPIIIEEAAAVVEWTGRLQGGGVVTTKSGPGTLVVSDLNVTSTDFVVEAGTLLINDPSTANLSNYTVQNDAVLGGSGMLGLGTGRSVTIESGGTLQGTLTVTGGAGVTVDDGGIVSPGDSAGTLSVSSLTLSEGSILNFDLSDPNVIGGGVNDLIAVDGDLTLGGVLNVAFLQDAVLMQPYTLFTYGTGLTDNGLEMGTGFPKSAYIDTSIFGQVNLVVIPEPASAVLLGLAGLILLRRPGGRRDGRQA